mgnify:CR=1 FL=1
MGRRLPVALALLLLVACGWRGPEAVQTWSHLEPVHNVIALDEAAWQLVSLSDYQIERGEDGRLDVVLELANLSSLDVEVQLQTVFRDGEGRLLSDETGWQMVVLPGNGSSRYEVRSLSVEAETFVVQVKTP